MSSVSLKKTQENHLSERTPVEQFGEDIRNIYKSLMSQLGEKDLKHMQKMKKLSWRLHNIGRHKIAEAKNISTWLSGIKMLSGHFCMEFANGHMILHGCYDNLPGSDIRSSEHRWNSSMLEEDWIVAHNVYHHSETNIIGKDHDFGFLLFRINERQEWFVHHLFQVPLILIGLPLNLTAFMSWYISTARKESEKQKERKPFPNLKWLEKVFQMYKENYLDYPLKSGLNFFSTLVGNYLAKLSADTIFVFMIAVEHLNDNLASFTEAPGTTEGEFYLQQILSTLNYYVDERFEDIFLGGINIHMEHHLFPDLPPNRLRESSYLVREVCEKYGVPYKSETWLNSIIELIGTGAKYSFPFFKYKDHKQKEIWKKMTERTSTSGLRLIKNNLTEYKLELRNSGKTVKANGSNTILESLEKTGMNPAYGCRKGVCRKCSVKKLSGKTSLEGDAVQTHVKICVAKPESDLQLVL
ncbi:MAG: fatty acid desaturase [Leptospiraceae bacterium]|nr:fatty acid desaturase [Leptospiraceae bacterium]